MAALEALAEVQREHGHLQEVILQNFVPHPRYYGAEPAEIADEAQRTRGARRAGAAAGLGAPDLARRHARAGARVPAADAGRGGPDPAQPVGLVAAAGRGGRDRPGRAVGQRRPHLARAPVPVGAPDAQAAPAARLRAHGAAVRLPAVHGPGLDGAGRARRGEAPVLVVHPAARLGPARGAADPARAGARRGRARPRGRGAVAGGADRAVRRDAPRGDRGHAPGGRRAARRAGRRHGHVRGQPQHQRLEHLRRRAARSAASARASARPTPTSTRRPSSAGACARRSSSGPPRSACSRASTRTGRSPTTSAGCGVAKDEAPEIHLHAYSPMEVDAMAGRPAAGRGVRAAARGRPRLDARHRRRGAPRRRARAHLARTSCRWGAGSR